MKLKVVELSSLLLGCIIIELVLYLSIGSKQEIEVETTLELVKPEPIEVINTERYKITWVNNSLEQVFLGDNISLEFDIYNKQEYPLIASIKGMTINGEEVTTYDYYGKVNPAKNDNATGYLTITVPNTDRKIGELNEVTFKLLLHSEYMEFSSEQEVIIAITTLDSIVSTNDTATIQTK